jgi:hypothetical protein
VLTGLHKAKLLVLSKLMRFLAKDNLCKDLAFNLKVMDKGAM